MLQCQAPKGFFGKTGVNYKYGFVKQTTVPYTKKQARRKSTKSFLTCCQLQREITTLVNHSPHIRTLPVDRRKINVVIVFMPV